MARGAARNRVKAGEGAPGGERAPGTAGAAAGYFFACLLLVFSLLARSELTAITERAVACSEEIRELEEENARLRILRGQAMDLAQAEETAAETLGMCRPRPGQPQAQKIVPPDRVTVLSRQGAARAAGALETMTELLGECFS